MAQKACKLMANFEHTVKEGKSQWGQTFGMTSEEAFANFYKDRESLIGFLEARNSRMKMSMSSVLGAFDLSGFSHLCDLGGICILYYAMLNLRNGYILGDFHRL